jgi:hypothetical protein
MLDVGRCTLDVGSWTLDVGRWMLDIGRWTLDVGHWTLDVGHYMLDLRRWTFFLGLNVGQLRWGTRKTCYQVPLSISVFPRIGPHWDSLGGKISVHEENKRMKE